MENGGCRQSFVPSFGDGQGLVTRTSSMYSFPVPPGVGAVRLPTPMYIVLTAVTFTPAAVKVLSGIFHVSQLADL
jgi:hypothetical protein